MKPLLSVRMGNILGDGAGVPLFVDRFGSVADQASALRNA